MFAVIAEELLSLTKKIIMPKGTPALSSRRAFCCLNRGIFAVPQNSPVFLGVRVALRGEHQHLAEAVQADGLPQLLVRVALHQRRDQAHAHRAGLAGDHPGVPLRRGAQHPHALGADPVRAGHEGGHVVAQDIPGDDIRLAAGKARHDGLQVAAHDAGSAVARQSALIQAVRRAGLHHHKFRGIVGEEV